MSHLNLLLMGLLPAGLLAKLQPTFPKTDRLLENCKKPPGFG